MTGRGFSFKPLAPKKVEDESGSKSMAPSTTSTLPFITAGRGVGRGMVFPTYPSQLIKEQDKSDVASSVAPSTASSIGMGRGILAGRGMYSNRVPMQKLNISSNGSSDPKVVTISDPAETITLTKDDSPYVTEGIIAGRGATSGRGTLSGRGTGSGSGESGI